MPLRREGGVEIKMPTQAVCDLFDKLRQDALKLISLQKYVRAKKIPRLKSTMPTAIASRAKLTLPRRMREAAAALAMDAKKHADAQVGRNRDSFPFCF